MRKMLPPPTLAFAVARSRNASRWMAGIAESFLIVVGAGVVMASFDVLPGLLNQFPKLPRADNQNARQGPFGSTRHRASRGVAGETTQHACRTRASGGQPTGASRNTDGASVARADLP